MIYSLKKFANMFKVTEYTVRYYTDIGILPCVRDGANRRRFTEESVNWMQGIVCLKGCGASIEAFKEYCDLCLLPEREQAYKRIEEAKATAAYMDQKVRHYEGILAGRIPDDSNPGTWTEETRPKMH